MFDGMAHLAGTGTTRTHRKRHAPVVSQCIDYERLSIWLRPAGIGVLYYAKKAYAQPPGGGGGNNGTRKALPAQPPAAAVRRRLPQEGATEV